eukprot:TRINITY_DN3313_c0_g1_i4.p1 TRINITY_DN3313_c0_g1~~TRINITY_DN3313_c0_g1_i4.p1  ORF type:complete len:192 (-),score=32.21 TRINITY_DN3313_c0_g1_i4:26-601(-)
MQMEHNMMEWGHSPEEEKAVREKPGGSYVLRDRRRGKQMLKRAVVVGGVAAIASGTLADNILQFDINGLSAEASGTFSESFTGTLDVFNKAGRLDTDTDARFEEVLINGDGQATGGADHLDFGFDMSITFAAGKITGGSVSVLVDQGGSENTYSASLAASAKKHKMMRSMKKEKKGKNREKRLKRKQKKVG